MWVPVDETNFHAVYGAWAVRDERDAAALLAGYPGPWWVVGGRAIEAFTGVTRPHEDIDIVVSRADFPLFREQVADRFHVWVNQSGSLTPLLPGDDDTYPPGSDTASPCSGEKRQPPSGV